MRSLCNITQETINMTYNLESSATYMDVVLRSTNGGPFVLIYFEDIHKSH